MLGLASNTPPLQRQTLVDSVYQHVLDAILSGRLASGTEFSEVALARELGVSRTPVHEALAWLAADDLVEIQANKVRVRKLTAREVMDLYEVRQLLECAAAVRAATRLEAGMLQSLQAQALDLASGQDEPGWPARAIAFDVRFHDELAAASDNARLNAEISRYRLLVRAFCRLTGENLQNLRDSLCEHVAILQALEKRDGPAASQAMAAHITSRLKAVLAAFYHDTPSL
jgi:DNA-binding GntR family transcriptional regulator